jgi:hypothetical protein
MLYEVIMVCFEKVKKLGGKQTILYASTLQRCIWAVIKTA